MLETPSWDLANWFGTPNSTVTWVVSLSMLGACAGFLVLLSRKDPSIPNIKRYEWDTSISGTAKKRWMWDSLNLLREGYLRFSGRPWQIWTSEGYQIVLPPAFLDELKMLPDHTCYSSLREFMLPQYTFKPFIPWKVDYVNRVILHDLNKNMSTIFPLMRDEVSLSIPVDLPGSTDWSEVDIAAQILRLICRISGRAFVGTELHRDEEWLDISCNVSSFLMCKASQRPPPPGLYTFQRKAHQSLANKKYTKDVFLSAMKLRAVPTFVRPLLALVLPDLRRVYRHHERAKSLIQPILQQRERDVDLKSKPDDAIQWIHDLIPEEDKKDYGFQGVAQLAITAVSAQSTSKLIVNIVLNLMKYVEYVPMLVEEIETTLASCGGEWTLESMNRLEKLDSFMRESLRFEPPLTATFQRRAAKPMTLSDGTAIPQGTLLLAPADAIAFDPEFYPDPERFDGLRFYKLAQQAEGRNRARHQFVSTSKTQVQFGLGRHACPGRWFAGHLIKMVVADILLSYDLKFREGEVRPKTFLFQTTNMPHPKTRILMKRKKA